ncbi:MFS transporter [Streptomyces sp900116325]|uniref:MFS transporter n=1 Tax=Streptomyces sp. 900116325 TaxID=3154295 RepID=A0ABV2U2X6_9ACTN
MLAVLAFAEELTPGLLLGLTFLLGCGTALMGPAWQTIQPELVERSQLGQAAALGAVNMNLARALGRALGGAVVAAAGAGWAALQTRLPGGAGPGDSPSTSGLPRRAGRRDEHVGVTPAG